MTERNKLSVWVHQHGIKEKWDISSPSSFSCAQMHVSVGEPCHVNNMARLKSCWQMNTTSICDCWTSHPETTSIKQTRLCLCVGFLNKRQKTIFKSHLKTYFYRKVFMVNLCLSGFCPSCLTVILLVLLCNQLNGFIYGVLFFFLILFVPFYVFLFLVFSEMFPPDFGGWFAPKQTPKPFVHGPDKWTVMLKLELMMAIDLWGQYRY